MRLTPEQGRVLGCLVEKQLTTPQLYPLTDNAVMAACNQSTSRDPVVSYDKTTVRLAVRTLREQQLLRTVHRTGERSDKHQHLLDMALSLTTEQISVLAVLLLRGPQTLAELRGRAERLHPFDTLEQVEEVLAALADRQEPLVARLERQAGRKESRYAQLLVEGMTVPPFPGEQAGPVAERVSPAAEPTPAAADLTDPTDPTDLAHLAHQVGLLRAEVAELRAHVTAGARCHSS